MVAVVGLDLSLTRTGIAHRDGTVGVIASRALRGIDRLASIRIVVQVAVTPWAGQDNTRLVVIEGYSYGSRTSHAHSLGELGGVVRLTLLDLGVPFVEVPPATLKKFATGRGNANKVEVIQAATKRLGYEGSDDNEADALWLRAIGHDLLGEPLCTLPAAHRAALDAHRADMVAP